MTTKEILATIDELARCKVFRIVVTGGEPLIHPDFFAIINAIVKYPIHLQFNTNATLITEKIIGRLKELPRRPRISVSLDGITVQTYDRIRGPGYFADMKRGIQMLTAAGLEVRPFVVVSGLNYRELPKIAEFAKSIGTGSIKIVDPTACGRAPRHAMEMALASEELPELFEMVLMIDRRHPGLLSGGWLQMAHFYRDLKERRLADRERSDGTFRNCGAAWNQAAIASDGTVAPCEMAFTYRAGNVRDQSFIDIWRNSPVFNAIRECRGMPLARVHGCEDCLWHRLCQGPCPAGGYTMYGIWPASEPVCLMRRMGELFDNEAIMQESRKAL
jgi:radical SAM protein with 4Fe4S-binding SPASM domain